MNGWEWDEWQQKVLDHEGNITIRAGRQCGKSEVISEKALRFALKNEKTVTLIIAASQRQSGLLFEKVRGRADAMGFDYPEKPTLTRLVLPNGSKIYSLPAGRTAYSIRGYTVDLLIADEAAYIPETVWTSVTPMMSVSAKERGFGWTITISTPMGKGGFFWETFHDKDYLQVHHSAEQSKRHTKKFLAKEKRRMSKQEYAQEYLAEFIDDYRQLFPTPLLKRQMTFSTWSLDRDKLDGSKFYLGVDVARYGGDENAFVVAELVGKKMKIVKCFVTDRVSTVDTIGRIVKTDQYYNFSKIFIDDTGVGGGVTDSLQEKLGNRVMGINNASRRVAVQGEERRKGILKEDLYSNALMLLETGRLELISDLDLLRSLKSVTFEYTSHGNVKIFGAYTHLAEAFVRAAWCNKEKGLDLYIY